MAKGPHRSDDTSKSENKFMLRWALATFVKGMNIGLPKNWLSILAEREVPQRTNWRWYGEFMINYDGYGFVPWKTCPTSCPTTQPLSPHPIPQHVPNFTNNTQQHRYHYHTTPGNANKTSTSHCDLKCHACSLIHIFGLNKVCHTCTVQPISIIINHKFITPPAIS